jgi:hypothetical protein
MTLAVKRAETKYLTTFDSLTMVNNGRLLLRNNGDQFIINKPTKKGVTLPHNPRYAGQ